MLHDELGQEQRSGREGLAQLLQPIDERQSPPKHDPKEREGKAGSQRRVHKIEGSQPAGESEGE